MSFRKFFIIHLPDKNMAMAGEKEKCEICGREYDRQGNNITDAIIDGTLKRACVYCSSSDDNIIIAKPTNQQLLDIHKSPVRKMAERIQRERTLQQKQDDALEFGKFLRKAREKADVTIAELAKAVGEPEQTIFNMEIGRIVSESVVIKVKQFIRTLEQTPAPESPKAPQPVAEPYFAQKPKEKEITISSLREMREREKDKKLQEQKQIQQKEQGKEQTAHKKPRWIQNLEKRQSYQDKAYSIEKVFTIEKLDGSKTEEESEEAEKK